MKDKIKPIKERIFYNSGEGANTLTTHELSEPDIRKKLNEIINALNKK